jgi:hypothetical protein
MSYQFLPISHNPNFYGQITILQKIQDALSLRDEDRWIRSVALWGTGGIGKSQITLEFASRQGTADIPIILWIPSERETEVASHLALDFDQDALRVYLEKSSAGSIEPANAYNAVRVQLTSLWRPQKGVEYQMNAIANSPTDHDAKLTYNLDH